MSRRKESRPELYYLALLGKGGKVCYGRQDYIAFIELMDEALAHAGCSLYAFCLSSSQLHLVFQLTAEPLQDFCGRLTLCLNLWLEQMRGHAEVALAPAGPPRLFGSAEKQRELIRFVHLLPLASGESALEYSWSGHPCYLGRMRLECFAGERALNLFGTDAREGREHYERFIFEGLNTVGSSRFAAALGRRTRMLAIAEARVKYGVIERPAPKIAGTFEALAERIALLGDRTLEDLRSHSRERTVSLLRAVVSWHGARLGLGAFKEIARYLHRDPSTLYAGIKRYGALYPQFFREPGNLAAIGAALSIKEKSLTKSVTPLKLKS